MRGIFWLMFLLATPHDRQASLSSTDRQQQFATTVQPILAHSCQPCHFTGGRMHDELPFDRHETIDKLGTKLFSRIKKEEEREIIRKFLASKK